MSNPTIPTWIRHDDGQEMIVETIEEYEDLISEGWWVMRKDKASSPVDKSAIEQSPIIAPTTKPRGRPGRPKKK